MVQTLIKTTGLTRRYGPQTAVDRVNLSVQSGEVYGLVGQNGAGKTTLMRLICGLTIANEGSLVLMGETTAQGLSRARQKMGSTVESPRFYPNLSASQNLEYYRLQRGIRRRDCTIEALEAVGLANTGAKKFQSFSLGMKQRLGLALAIMSQPELIILDEPINGLDPTGIIEIRGIIQRLASEGIGILVSSHILSELSQVASRYGFMHQGSLLLQMSAQELTQACRRTLEVSVSNAAEAAAVLEAQLGIRDCRIVSNEWLRLYSHLDQSAPIIQTLITANITVSAMTEVGDSLEDFYTNLIKNGMKAAPEGSGAQPCAGVAGAGVAAGAGAAGAAGAGTSAAVDAVAAVEAAGAAGAGAAVVPAAPAPSPAATPAGTKAAPAAPAPASVAPSSTNEEETR
ncbi:MAG: ATP-binding cassette domain-containing protein [Coriobacteriales bacterium]|jgi:ABC-2 type transport system ATP-binding protein|nr:ATP-binding cassette domain-containing protein [Coriobacteriales bacterium]